MSKENDKTNKAAEIDAAIKKADADKGEDGVTIDKVLTAIGDIATKVDGLCGRMDALETGAKKVTEPGDQTKPMQTAADGENLSEHYEAQARADEAAQAWGARAPKPLFGEDLMAYRNRLIKDHKPHSKDYAAIDLAGIKGAVFDIAERQIFADSIEASRTDAFGMAPGALREIRRPDLAGRTISTFVGPNTFITTSKHPLRRVARFLTPNSAGYQGAV